MLPAADDQSIIFYRVDNGKVYGGLDYDLYDHCVVTGQLKVMDSDELMETVPTGRYKYLHSVFNRAISHSMRALRNLGTKKTITPCHRLNTLITLVSILMVDLSEETQRYTVETTLQQKNAPKMEMDLSKKTLSMEIDGEKVTIDSNIGACWWLK